MTATLAEVDRIRPIDLEELVARAELLVRVDRKYLLEDPAVEQLLEQMPPGTRVLEIDGQRQIEYRTLYHDTPALEAYRGTAQRRRRRFKVRTREYGTGGCYLEVKTRQGRYTVKERTECSAVAGMLDQDAMTYVVERLENAGIPLDEHLESMLWTAYRRTTLLLPDESKVTLDSGLIWNLSDTRRRRGPSAAGPAGGSVRCDGYTIVEVKSARQASAADRVLWADGNRPVGLSKYGTGLAALIPQLPNNRWHRILAGRLGITLDPLRGRS